MRFATIVLAFLLSLLYVFLNGKTIFAASVTYTSPGQSFSYTDEIPLSVTLSISARDQESYYLRGVFYKEGSNNYCGLTWNGTAYYSGPYTTNDGWKNFLKVAITDNLWTGEVKLKIDNEDSGCRDSGVYQMKIERFTESGSGSFDNQEPLILTFLLPTPTIVPIPTAKISPSIHITPTKVIGPTKMSSNSLVQSRDQELTKSEPTIVIAAIKPNAHYVNYKSSEEAVLGAATESADETINSPTPTRFPIKVLGTSTSLWPLILSTIGGGTLVVCGILAFQIYKKSKLL